jgi:hypothetical protein
MYTMMGLALVFSADPELSSLIAACVKPVVKDRNVDISIKLGSELVKRISVYLEQNGDRLAKKFGGKKVKSQKKKQKAAPIAPMAQ